MVVFSWGRPRRGRILLWTALALAVIFIGLAVYQKFYGSGTRFVADVDLVEEIRSAEFLDDAPETTPWAQWRGPKREGIISRPNLLRDWPARGPRRLWSREGGDGYSSFSVAGGRAFTMVEGGDNVQKVLGFNPDDGKTVWERSFPAEKTFDYGGPRATPTLADGRLYGVTSAGLLFCLAQADGKPIWQTDTRQVVDGTPGRWGYAYSPLVVGKHVYAVPGGKDQCVAAFDRDTGEVVWATQTDPAGYSSPVTATVDGVEQVLFFTGRRLLAVTPETGDLIWEFLWDTKFEVNAATPLVVRARAGKETVTYVFISSGYGKGCALVKIIPQGEGRFTAKAVYQGNELCCHFASPVRYKDHVYALDETRDLTCLDLRTGKIAWRFAKDEAKEGGLRNLGFKKGSIVRIDDVLLVLGEDGKLALVAADPREYRELAAARPFRDRCWTTPVLDQGRLLIRDRKRIVALDLRGKKAEK